jgi:hypothetical protein
MIRLFVVALVVLLAPATFTLAQAETYSITVAVDETTDGDLSLIETFLASANNGDLISQSLRQIIMAAVGEIWMLVDGRTDANGNLTLDDGTVQPLRDGDVIKAKKKKKAKKKDGGGGAEVTFVCGGDDAGPGGCRGRPDEITVCPPPPGQGCRTVMPGKWVMSW